MAKISSKFPPSVLCAPQPESLFTHIWWLPQSENIHMWGLMWRAWLWHIPPVPWWCYPFLLVVSHILLPCGHRIWPIFAYPVVATFATSLYLWHTFPRFFWVLSVCRWISWAPSRRVLRLCWVRWIVVPPWSLLAPLRLVAFGSLACRDGEVRRQDIGSLVCHRGVGYLQECWPGAWCQTLL